MFDGIGIPGGKNISVTSRDQLVVVSGQRSVEMKPGNLGIFFIAIFLRFIAVQKQELSPGNGAHPALQLHPAGTFYHLQQKKAVIVVSAEIISFFLVKVADDNGVQIDFGGCGAGLIQVIVRSR